MILRHDKTSSHIDEQDPIADWLVRCIKSAHGTSNLEIGSQSAVKIDIINNGSKITVDLLEAAFFSTSHDEIGLFDRLKSTKEFAKKLTDWGQVKLTHDITISFLRKGKEVIIIGSDAQPTLSKLITRNNDVQVNSVSQATNL